MKPINPYPFYTFTREIKRNGTVVGTVHYDASTDTHSVEMKDSAIVTQAKRECAEQLAKASQNYRKGLEELQEEFERKLKQKENDLYIRCKAFEEKNTKIEQKFLIKELNYRKQIDELQTKLNIASNLKLNTFLEERGHLFTSQEIDRLLTRVLDH